MSREASGVSPPSTVAASSGRRAQEPRSLPAPSGPRPFTSPPSHRNSQPPPFSPSPSGLPPGIIFEEAGASRKRWATHSNPARTPAALKRQRPYRSGPGGETAASLPSARRSRWGSRNLGAHQHGPQASQAPPTPRRLLSRSRVKRQPIPEALSGYGDETPRTAQAPASLDDPGGPGGQRPSLSFPCPFPPRRPPD